MWLFIVGIVIIELADRLTKAMAASGRTWQMAGFHFIFQPNDALVFSWPAPNWVAMVAMGLALVVLLWLTRLAVRRDRIAMIGCMCMLVGAVSNGYDRLVFGYVIDWGYLGRWFPVFNLADLLVAVGVILVLTRWTKLTSAH